MRFCLSSFFVAIAIIVHLSTAASAATTSVTATVSTTLTCSTDGASTAFGTLSTGSVTTASPNITSTVSCNGGGGCTLYVNDAGNSSSPGLYASTATSTPIILSATTGLVAGTEGYGIQAATSSAGSGATLAISATYLKTGNNVGGLALAATAIASSTSPISGREVVVTHKAAISTATKAGSYADTITYSCLSN